jgi:Family of unknown function (DUF6194)
VTPDDIVDFVDTALPGTIVVVASEENGDPEVAWDDTFFFYDPDGVTVPERRLPYATIVTGDYPGFDEASNLDRPDVFRVNVWVGRDTFAEHAGDDDVDFAVLDQVIPHPVYGKQSWLSVLNPGPQTEEVLRDLLREAHSNAATRYEKRRDIE